VYFFDGLNLLRYKSIYADAVRQFSYVSFYLILIETFKSITAHIFNSGWLQN